MNVALSNAHIEKTRALFRDAGLHPSGFSECTEEQVALLVQLQADVLAKSYADYCSMIDFCSTRYIYAKEYKKRKSAFATYAATNEGAASIGGMTAATVLIYRNAMKFELNQLALYFYIFWATRDDLEKASAGKITPDPPEVILERYGNVSGCLSLLCVLCAALGSLLALTWSFCGT